MKITPVGRKFGRYNPGEVFELPDRASKVLIKLGKVAEYQAKVIEPEPAKVEEEISPRTGLPKRQYRRRDMTAEE
jgi:hypothetical protein